MLLYIHRYILYYIYLFICIYMYTLQLTVHTDSNMFTSGLVFVAGCECPRPFVAGKSTKHGSLSGKIIGKSCQNQFLMEDYSSETDEWKSSITMFDDRRLVIIFFGYKLGCTMAIVYWLACTTCRVLVSQIGHIFWHCLVSSHPAPLVRILWS